MGSRPPSCALPCHGRLHLIRLCLVLVVLATVWLSTGRVLAAEGTLPGGTAISLDITAPISGTVLQATAGAVTLQGNAAVGAGAAAADTLIVYVLDVSGSVDEEGLGCGDDANDDGRSNTVLDCQIAATIALNVDAVRAGSVGEVGLVAFSGYSRFVANPPLAAVAADLSPEAGIQGRIAPDADVNGSGGLDLDEATRSAIARDTAAEPAYGLRQFTPLAAGAGFTNYFDAVQVALELLNASTLSNKLVIFMSDGDSTAGRSLNRLRDAVVASGAVIHSFAVGSDTGFSCTTDSNGYGTLQEVAQLSEPDGSCVEVRAVADLPNVVPALIRSELTALSVQIDDGEAQHIGASVPISLPQPGPISTTFDVALPMPPVGPRTICAVVSGSDAGGSGEVRDCVDIVVNGAPVGATDQFTTAEDVPLIVPAPGLLVNDVDPNQDPLTASLLTVPVEGAASLALDGTLVYTPTRHADGIDTFTYQADDGQGGVSPPITVTITVTPDAFLEVTNLCDSGVGSLRSTLERANRSDGPDTVIFDIIDSSCGVSGTIALQSPLPDIVAPLVIEGTVREDGSPHAIPITLDGSVAGEDAAGLVIGSAGQGSVIKGLSITNFSGSGIVVGAPDAPSNDNLIAGNNIFGNDADGITLFAGVNNRIVDNDIYANGDLDIDLGGDGPTPNDVDDADQGANFVQNYPVLFRATPTLDDVLRIEGRLNTQTNADYTLQFFAAPSCSGEAGQVLPIGAEDSIVTTDALGAVYFQKTVATSLPIDWGVRATATDAMGNTSELSDCILVSIDNDSWPRALPLTVAAQAMSATVANGQAAETAAQTWTVRQYLDQFGQARWYRFPVQPDSEILVTLTGLPANYDLTLYKDIAEVFADLIAPADEDDLHRLSAEFAPSAFSPSAFSPSAFSPSAFSPSAFSPSAFSPSAFSPSAFSPSAFSPSAFSPSAFSPSAFSPSAFSPSAFSPSAFSPSAFSPSAFSPSAFSPSAFSSAQMRSLVGVSAIDGTAKEQLRANTWNNDGDFYVRVRGREGAFSQAAPFELTIDVTPSGCDTSVFSTLPETSLVAQAGGYRTLILTDLARLNGETDAMVQTLDVLAARPEVKGTIVDLGADTRVLEANRLADSQSLVSCPYAKNVVAEAIKAVVDRYWEANPTLEYIVLVGNDDVIPFYRYPDNALLGDESNYYPPVQDGTASQASLRRSYVLSQDAYGAEISLSLNATDFPVPKLAVGRLVETPADIIAVLDAYLSTPDGVVPTPSSALVTGYDFLVDAAQAVKAELETGLGDGVVVDSLITPADQSPLAPTIDAGGEVWTARNLDQALRNKRHDLLFLAGHFNANSALAADYATSLISTDVRDFAADLTNAIVFSVGCHSGYNIVNEHGIPGVTFEPDWAQVFAQRGATFVGGTGYQYGDTEFLEYSERLYLEFSRQLRTGTGPVAVGNALVRAKQRYLETTPSLRGIHEKSLLQSTLFGLPMIRVDMPGTRIIPTSETGAIATEPVAGDPGATLGLETSTLAIATTLTERVTELTNLDDPNTSVQARWLEGGDGVVTNAAEPALPLELRTISAARPGLVLRGVGLWEAQYDDTPEIIPLTGAPTTEMRGVHSPFLSDVFYPLRLWNVNYFGELTGTGIGTRLALTPAQHRSTNPGAPTNTRRSYSSVTLRLYYSGNVFRETSGADVQVTSSPSASAPPSIVSVQSMVAPENMVTFQVRVVGNPAAGVQDVWVTYTGVDASPFYGTWQSLTLSQDPQDSTLWTGQLELGTGTPGDMRFIVQAANGVGLITMADNLGRAYRAGADVPVTTTNLVLEPYMVEGPFGTTAEFAAVLRDNEGVPLAEQIVYVALGVQVQVARTDANGVARVGIPLLGQPGPYGVRAAFPGTLDLAAAAVEGADPFTVTQQATFICLDTDLDNDCDADDNGTVSVEGRPVLLAAILQDANAPPRRQIEQTILFDIAGDTGNFVVPATTDFNGRAFLPALTFPPGTYTVTARYPGTEPLAASVSTSSGVELVEEQFHVRLPLIRADR